MIEDDKAACHVLHCNITTLSLKFYNDELYEQFWSWEHTGTVWYNFSIMQATILQKYKLFLREGQYHSVMVEMEFDAVLAPGK